MKKIIQFFKKLYFKLWLKKQGINPAELLQGVQVQKFLDKNPRLTFSLNLKDLVMPELDLSNCPDFSEYLIEVDYETV